MKYTSRRNFINSIALSGVATICLTAMEPYNALAKKRKLALADGSVILFQGDSITDGNRGRTADPNHIMGHGYAFSVASRWGADFPEKKIAFFNRGISGNKVNDLAKRWKADTLDLNPSVLSILVGVNDAASVVFQREPVISAERYEAEYKSLIEQTLQMFPDILLVLCEPFILKVGKVKDNWEAYHADMVKRQAVVLKLSQQYNTVFVAFQEVFDKATENAAADYWMWDGVHPTVAGHELMARKWIKQVEKRLKF